jgi:AraC-like DNA-binding protein
MRPMDDQVSGQVRFHHLTPELWVMEARGASHRWVVFHEAYEFCLVTKLGGGLSVPWRYNHREYVADLRNTMSMQPGELHANVDRTPPADFIVVNVGDDLMKRVARELGWNHAALNVRAPQNGDPRMLRALQRFRAGLCTDLYDPRPGAMQCTCRRHLPRHLESLDHLVAAFIESGAESARLVVPPGNGAAAVRRALSYLQRNYREPYDPERVARVAGCGARQLAHLFTTEVGIPPSSYQSRILVAKTCQALIAAPQQALKGIAAEVGWPAPAKDGGKHGGKNRGKGTKGDREQDRTALLVRQFRQILHVTPAMFRAGL